MARKEAGPHHEPESKRVEGPVRGVIQAMDPGPRLDEAQHVRKAALPRRQRLERLGLEDGVGAADTHITVDACTCRERSHPVQVFTVALHYPVCKRLTIWQAGYECTSCMVEFQQEHLLILEGGHPVKFLWQALRAGWVSLLLRNC